MIADDGGQGKSSIRLYTRGRAEDIIIGEALARFLALPVLMFHHPTPANHEDALASRPYSARFPRFRGNRCWRAGIKRTRGLCDTGTRVASTRVDPRVAPQCH